MALRNAFRGAAISDESLIELFSFGRRKAGEFRCDPSAEDRGVTSPRHQIFEEDVAVRYENSAISELDRMQIGDGWIMIAGEPRGRRRVRFEKLNGLFCRGLGSEGSAAGAGVERVAVEDDLCCALEERLQISERSKITRAVPVVEIGKNADHVTCHD